MFWPSEKELVSWVKHDLLQQYLKKLIKFQSFKLFITDTTTTANKNNLIQFPSAFLVIFSARICSFTASSNEVNSSISIKFGGATKRNCWKSTSGLYFMLFSLFIAHVLFLYHLGRHIVSLWFPRTFIGENIMSSHFVNDFFSCFNKLVKINLFVSCYSIYDVLQYQIDLSWYLLSYKFFAGHCCCRHPWDFLPTSPYTWSKLDLTKKPYRTGYIGHIRSSCQSFFNLEWFHQYLPNGQFTQQTYLIL